MSFSVGTPYSSEEYLYSPEEYTPDGFSPSPRSKTAGRSRAPKGATNILKNPEQVKRRNARERRRVSAVNSAFINLRDHIPAAGKTKKISKVDTLRGASEYIQYLKQVLQDSPYPLPATPPATFQPEFEQKFHQFGDQKIFEHKIFEQNAAVADVKPQIGSIVPAPFSDLKSGLFRLDAQGGLAHGLADFYGQKVERQENQYFVPIGGHAFAQDSAYFSYQETP